MQTNKSTVLITGGAGFIGSHTADLLLKRGYSVKILDNLSSKSHYGKWPDYLNTHIQKIKGDVRYKKDLRNALQGVRYVIHLAAWMDTVSEFSKFFSINTVGTANLYEVIVHDHLAIDKIVIASSQFVYGQGLWNCPNHGDVFPQNRSAKALKQGRWDPVCPLCNSNIKPLPNKETHQDPPNQYALSKYTQELIGITLGKLYDIPSSILRYSIVHGSRQTLKSSYSGALRQFFLWLENGRDISVYEDGQQLRDFVSVYDVAEANLKVMESRKADFRIFNVGGGGKYTVVDLAKMVGKCMGKAVVINTPNIYRIGDTRHSFSDISSLRHLGWEPRHTEIESIKKFIEWAKTQKTPRSSVNTAQKKLLKTGIIKQVIR